MLNRQRWACASVLLALARWSIFQVETLSTILFFSPRQPSSSLLFCFFLFIIFTPLSSPLHLSGLESLSTIPPILTAATAAARKGSRFARRTEKSATNQSFRVAAPPACPPCLNQNTRRCRLCVPPPPPASGATHKAANPPQRKHFKECKSFFPFRVHVGRRCAFP